MLKIWFLILFVIFSPSWAEDSEDSQQSGYRYIVDNYFSKRQSSSAYQDYSRSFTLFSGLSFYRESTKKTFDPYSSFLLGFKQNIIEISRLGDVDLQVTVFSSKMINRRALLLEITPRISVPEVRTTFPVYVGIGTGFGFYPRYIVQKIPSFSVNCQLFAGLRFLDLYHNLGFSAELNLRMHYPFSELEIYLEALGQLGLVFRF